MRVTLPLLMLISGCLFWDVGGLPPERKCGDEGATPDGHRCSCDRDCTNYGHDTLCLAEYQFGTPGGTCSHSCRTDKGCADGYVCDVPADDPSAGICRELCATSDDCGPGRHCGMAAGSLTRVCRALCDDDSDCDNESCNVYSGKCNLYGERPRGAGLNEACKSDSDCRSRYCSAEGRCITDCDRDAQLCPDGGLCVDGICMNACSIPRDCARDQSCIESEHGPYCGAE